MVTFTEVGGILAPSLDRTVDGEVPRLKRLRTTFVCGERQSAAN